MSAQNNITLKFKDISINQIVCDAVKMGEDIVPLLKYGSDKKRLNIQGPWIKMKQYGIPPGETLSNGMKNEYYANENSRFSIKFPIDQNCSVQTDPENKPDLTNSNEINDFITFLKDLDNHITDATFMKFSGIDVNDKGKYTPVYRKPGKSKKAKPDSKVKYYSMKTKLDTDGKDEDEKKIKTEFHLVDQETKQTSLVNTNKYISMKKLEETVKFNSEVLPVFQLVKIWTQSNGTWGVTLKLMKARVRNSVYSEKGNAEFLDSDQETNEQVAEEIKPKAKAVAKSKLAAHDSESDSDEKATKVVAQTFHKINKSDDESDDEPATKIVAQTSNKINKDNDDDDSDDEPATKVQVKKHFVDNDSESEDEKPKKNVKKVAAKSKKANA
jgi:hypothetical protein